MRQIAPITLALLLAACGAAPASSALSPTAASSATPSLAPTASPTPLASYSPKAEGFASKVLVEQKRNLATSAVGLIWIVPGASNDGSGVSATISEKESFTGSYQLPIDRQTPDAKRALYATPDLPPLPAGNYGESLRLVTLQPVGRSSAHTHSGIEGVLVLEGKVLVRSGGNAPAYLAVGQGFYILPKIPVQLINVGDTVARTLVYSISPDGQPFSTELDQAP